MTTTTSVVRLLDQTEPDAPWPGRATDLISAVRTAGLTGRGGGGFPTWRKLAAVARTRRPVVIGNAAEGEPASRKDLTLLQRRPHLVLDGLLLAARAVNASRCYLYASPAAAAHARRALAQRPGDRVSIVEAPDTFLAGEETAVLNAIAGRRAVPRDRQQPLPQLGFLVQNVETLAHLAQIARYGADWFRDVGSREAPGTYLATVSGAVATPGVYEVPTGTAVDTLLAMAGGVRGHVLVGGYHGTWDSDQSRGAGVVMALPTGACGLVETARVMSYLARQSAGQCGPCRNGLPRIADLLGALARRQATPDTVRALHTLAGLVTGRGACHHPDASVRLLRSTLITFEREVDAHLRGGCTR
ncbi:NADH-ubiquinone oxidoreductase-F iron-sulfur binding region domain-containing protein [Kutzneria albida]|uniref:Respiratory-chain NADH dehydrogenase domain-containing protein n=1 Tax=Kutzneria albida DSM 43870 TaxID=1449976 RepID=W5W7T6_9PSEU|nr:NADH-ubiquinone oxidoreductase-F iron-sulfur binding region domain-containing protein [Kutzneria albida]AHH96606.1 respiratory-chain NADH dehydrogenase domain-containing protein [Kutzneria albida DSM 43870]